MTLAEILAIFGPILAELLKKCLEEDGNDAVLDRLLVAGPLVKRRLKTTLQKQGLRGAELNNAVDEAIIALRRADKATVQNYLNTVKGM